MLKHLLLWDACVSVSAITCLNICKQHLLFDINCPISRDVELNSSYGPNICAHMDIYIYIL